MQENQQDSLNQNQQNELENKGENQNQSAKESIGGTSEPSELENLQNQLDAKSKECQELNDKLLRMAAELDNFRRRSREELEKTAKYAVSGFVSDLVVVAENFFMASKNAPLEEIAKNDAIKNYHQAIQMTEKELMKIFEKNQVSRIDPLGEQFDHNFHEAIARLDSEEEEGKILAVIQAGYVISDRLIRPALVSVAKKPS